MKNFMEKNIKEIRKLQELKQEIKELDKEIQKIIDEETRLRIYVASQHLDADDPLKRIFQQQIRDMKRQRREKIADRNSRHKRINDKMKELIQEELSTYQIRNKVRKAKYKDKYITKLITEQNQEMELKNKQIEQQINSIRTEIVQLQAKVKMLEDTKWESPTTRTQIMGTLAEIKGKEAEIKTNETKISRNQAKITTNKSTINQLAQMEYNVIEDNVEEYVALQNMSKNVENMQNSESLDIDKLISDFENPEPEPVPESKPEPAPTPESEPDSPGTLTEEEKKKREEKVSELQSKILLLEDEEYNNLEDRLSKEIVDKINDAEDLSLEEIEAFLSEIDEMLEQKRQEKMAELNDKILELSDEDNEKICAQLPEEIINKFNNSEDLSLEEITEALAKITEMQAQKKEEKWGELLDKTQKLEDENYSKFLDSLPEEILNKLDFRNMDSLSTEEIEKLLYQINEMERQRQNPNLDNNHTQNKNLPVAQKKGVFGKVKNFFRGIVVKAGIRTMGKVLEEAEDISYFSLTEEDRKILAIIDKKIKEEQAQKEAIERYEPDDVYDPKNGDVIDLSNRWKVPEDVKEACAEEGRRAAQEPTHESYEKDENIREK